ncbi:hypothetical protein BHU72_02240 [Desulfuribacillus stibiiarsenatis]|uniref:BPL/LPL catalytic domain-containing protein n=1 Tax=Desulfuribacillus stibiiarsenatis TaxID=1390249 RepID=A0A1E5L6G3_9FIRM|nr:biotin/lipoate A/B protein ligase family protein [Desulfuribacillus stibiiarsenatis]OEH85638.1 hypothetical protein BHU72_02240 [Desulfuribacillus stibiiarsenatis]
MEEWRLIIDQEPLAGSMNMAIDEAIHTLYTSVNRPTLRFYQWARPTISIGYFQFLEREIDGQALKERNMDIIRRQTGGRTVLHSNEITYSIVIPEQHAKLPPGTNDSYRKISQCLQVGFRYLQIETSWKSNVEKMHHQTSACFDTPAKYELLIDGKKIVGSAQKREAGVILQHGSIPIKNHAYDLFDVLKFESVEERKHMRKRYETKASYLEEVVLGEVSSEQVIHAFCKGFQEVFAVHLKAERLLDEEKKLALSLVANKYGTHQWNYRR